MQRVVYHRGGDKATEPVDFQVTTTFADSGDGRTLLTMRIVFPSAAVRDHVVTTYGVDEGLTQTLGSLGERLAAGASPQFLSPFCVSATVRSPIGRCERGDGVLPSRLALAGRLVLRHIMPRVIPASVPVTSTDGCWVAGPKREEPRMRLRRISAA